MKDPTMEVEILCPYCRGKGCKECNDSGYVSEEYMQDYYDGIRADEFMDFYHRKKYGI